MAGLLGSMLLLASCLAKPAQGKPDQDKPDQDKLAQDRPGADPHLQITGVEIYNGLPYSVKDVRILVPASGDFVSCGQILPDSSCSTTFPARDYRENPVQLNWTEHGQAQSTKPFKIKAPQAAQPGQSAYIRVEVFATGQAGAKLLLVETGTP